MKYFSIAFLLAFSRFAGAQVMINEVLVQPLPDTLLFNQNQLADCPDTTSGAEWIEIYNASKCDTIDISCYVLGFNTSDSNHIGFAFPPGTFINPLSFLVIGGKNAPGVDFALPDFCGSNQVCGSMRWLLNDDNGYVALYRADGTVSDALFWTSASGQANQLVTNPVFGRKLCKPNACTGDSLITPAQMTPGVQVLYAGRVAGAGLSLFRTVDGTGTWQTDGATTPGSCNGPCASPSDLDIQITNFSDERCLQRNGWVKATVTGGITPYDIDWNNTQNADSIFGLSAGTYIATVTDDLGCVDITSVTITNIGNPVSVSIEPEQSIIFKGEKVQLNVVTTTSLASITWSPESGLTCNDCSITEAGPNIITTYTVAVTDSNGCTGTASATVQVLSDENSVFVPTAFTPNNDNLNDILFLRSPKLSTMEWRIFDRWGTEVFFSNDPNSGWNGLDKKGKEMDAGIYVYYAIVTFDNGKKKTIKGNVALLR